MGDRVGGDDEWGQLGRELRENVGDEFRADAEEGERLAALALRRSRSLVDIARDAMSRGDTVVVAVPRRTFIGVVTYASGDLVRLRTSGGVTDVNLAAPASLRIAARADHGGRSLEPGPRSFRARLRELELERSVLELGSALPGGDRRGRLAAVALDHVVFEDVDGDEWYVPVDAISFLTRRDDDL